MNWTQTESIGLVNEEKFDGKFSESNDEPTVNHGAASFIVSMPFLTTGVGANHDAM